MYASVYYGYTILHCCVCQCLLWKQNFALLCMSVFIIDAQFCIAVYVSVYYGCPILHCCVCQCFLWMHNFALLCMSVFIMDAKFCIAVYASVYYGCTILHCCVCQSLSKISSCHRNILNSNMQYAFWIHIFAY